MPKNLRISKAMRSSDPITVAKAWIEMGIKVVVLHGIDEDGTCTCGRSNCRSPGKHPYAAKFPKGEHSATNDIAKVRLAFKREPRANLAIVPTGNIVVLDADGPEGAATYRSLGLSLHGGQ